MPEQSSPRGGLAVLWTVLTVSVVGFASTGSSPDGKGGASPAAPVSPAVSKPPGKASSPLSDNDPYKPFVSFWALADPEQGRKYVEQLPPQLLDPSRAQVDFLIATVPDPIDTRFAYRFDSILDDVQMAIESQDWNLDHFWLPWMPTGAQPGKRVDLVQSNDPPSPSPQSYTARAEPIVADGRMGLAITAAPAAEVKEPPEKASDPWRLLPNHQRVPGVLLFRKQWVHEKDWKKPQQLLALFVVGETPTTGIHKIPLSMTLDIIQEIHARRAKGKGPVDSPPPFRIVGPNYSGSVRSLSYAIREWSNRAGDPPGGGRWNFIVRSGGASSILPPKFVSDCGPKVKVTFDATVIHSDDVILGLLEYLKHLNRGGKMGRIALLTESDTDYGKALRSRSLKLREQDYDVTEMKFPFHVSQVAIAYDQNRREDGRSTPTLIRPSNKLRIPFDETGSPRDVVPSLSPAMSSATDEFVMSRILDTISKEHYRYVGIVATDTRDMIFLAGLVRDFCPDVQLFVPSGDLLLGHPEYAPLLQGTIVASTYPLFSMAQRWDPPRTGDRRRHLFSHESDQGYYNATLSLLAEGAKDKNPYFKTMYDYGRPFDEFEDISLFNKSRGGTPIWSPDSKPPWELARRELSERPALWFGVVGQRGLWPVGFVEGNSKPFVPGYVHAESVITDAVKSDEFVKQYIPLVTQFTWQWGTVFLLLTAGVGLVVRCQFHGGRPPFAFSWLSSLLRPLDDGASRGLRMQHELGILLALAVLLAVYVHFGAGPCWITLWDSSWRIFLDGGRRAHLSWSDRQNWWFGCAAIILSQVAVAVLVVILIARLARSVGRLWISAGRGTVSPSHAARNASRRRPAPEARRVGWRRLALVLFLIMAAVGIEWHVMSTTRHQDHYSGRSLSHPLLYFERAVNLGSGVSPLLPALILSLAACSWLVCQLRRVFLYRRLMTPIPVPESKKDQPNPFGSIAERGREIEALLTRFVPGRLVDNPACLLGVLVVLIIVMRLLLSFVPTVDGYRFNLAMIGAICLLIFSVLISLYRFMIVWGRIKALLDELSSLNHLLPAFDRIPKFYSRLLGRYLDGARPRLSDLTIPVGQWSLVATDRSQIESYMREHYVKTGELAEKNLKEKLGRISPAHKSPHEILGDDLYLEHREDLAVAHTPTRAGLRNAAVACLEILSIDWSSRHPDDDGRAVDPKPEEDAKPAPAGGAAPVSADWQGRAEDLVALEFVTYVSQCATHLRNLASLLGIVPVLLLLTVSVYPFQPQRFLIFALVGLLLVVVSGVIGVYVQMDRNEILSRISRITPNRVTLDRTFLTNILAFLVPLIGLIISKFPSLSDTLNQWFDPILRSLK